MSVMIGFPSCDFEELPTWTELVKACSERQLLRKLSLGRKQCNYSNEYVSGSRAIRSAIASCKTFDNCP